MSRRPDPARIAAAKRAGTRERMISDGVSETKVDAWLDAWTRDNDGQSWDGAYEWILGQVAMGKKPPAGSE
jgi:hypothetical protein